MLKIITIIILLNFTAINSAFAQDNQTANAESNDQFLSSKDNAGVAVRDIYRACKNYFESQFNTKENVARKGTCNGYFFGIGSTLLTLSLSNINTSICLPEDISTEQVISDFLVWAKSNPNAMQYLATEGTLTALTNKYPCV